MATGESTAKGGSLLGTLVNIFVSPREAYEAIDRRPTWVFPLVLVLLSALVAAIFITPMAMEERMAEQRDKLIEKRGMTPEEADRALEVGAKIGKITGPVMAPIATVVVLVVVTLALLFLGNVVLGGASNFKKIFAMYTWTSLIGVLATIVKTPLMLSRGTVDLQTSLAAFLDPAQKGTFLYQLLARTDVFSLWELVLVCIGMAVIYRFTTKKAATGVVALYLVYAVAAAAVTAALT
ncbi:MAG: YIP1 family protein [candidate division KSB1 bacterium]|nr:YIP1 family protein [candidate division KSB1 bacterium]MDZ7295137.1 YIP1 family protein [candidate division KSB1 bacterium]MDZ7385573.1 YIP1 family protein [candidate division KSB1 bacterium]MDZ7391949.1 YIP1 family protein [candidate division KSB1 bacterium]MDZ7412024.1 YIP1 family protein [candidate division KSB1 bacterium]